MFNASDFAVRRVRALEKPVDIAGGKRIARLCRRSALSLPFELVDEGLEMRGHGRRKGVVLVLEALPDRREPNASIASGTELVLKGMCSVAVPTDPIVQPVGC
jgi:hypothetical protein